MMKRILLLACLAAGCNSNAEVGGLDGSAMDLPAVGDLARVCNQTCAGCASDEICYVSEGVENTGHEAFCARTCTTSSDCARGSYCLAFFGAVGKPRVCVSPQKPSGCPNLPDDPSWHCDFPPPSCVDGQTLRQGLNSPDNRVCGTEHVRCPNACVAAGGDGGLAARCR